MSTQENGVKCKKDKLQVSYHLMKDFWMYYQNVVRTAQNNYFSNIISKSSGNRYKAFEAFVSTNDPPPFSVSDAYCTEF